MLAIVVSIITIPMMLIALTWFPWPDIPQDMLTTLNGIFANLGYLNHYVAVDTFLIFAFAIMTIEVALKVIDIFDTVRSSITGKPKFFGAITKKDS